MPECDFADLPALGDALVDESCDESLSEKVPEPVGKYRFNGRYMYVIWSKSTISSKEEFQKKLLPLLPPNIQYFGGRNLHQDGTPHYHVVFQFEKKVHWPDAIKHLRIVADTNAICIRKPRPCKPIGPFLEKTQCYCSKDGDTFGERISLEGAVSEMKKRKWQQIVDEPDEDFFIPYFGTDNVRFLKISQSLQMPQTSQANEIKIRVPALW